jgi:hypothetical protein
MEWNEEIRDSLSRRVRGGSFLDSAFFISAPNTRLSTTEDQLTGFRVASIPEPGTGLLLMAGLLGLAQRRRSDA